MSTKEKEKKNEQMGAIISVGAHVLVFLLFFFMVAWRAPDPPMPEIGIELNFGLEDAGSGDVQPEPNTQPAESESEEEAAPDGLEETPEEDVVEPVTEPTEQVDAPSEEVITPVENTQDSPDVVEEIPEKVVKEESKEEVKKEVETAKLLYKSKTSGAGGKEGDSKEVQNAGQGNQPNETGVQGNKDGTIDSRSLLGKNGGGSGATLDINGWMWTSKPDKKDPFSERGTLILQFVIDYRGEVLTVTTIETGVGATVVNFYKAEVMKLTFAPISGSTLPSTSTGTITFVIKDR